MSYGGLEPYLQASLEYMERMGIKNTQFFIAQHFRQGIRTVHITFNRIDNNSNTISDRHERLHQYPHLEGVL